MRGPWPRSRFLRCLALAAAVSLVLCGGSLLAPRAADAFFYAVRYSRPLRGSCIPDGEASDAKGPVHNATAFGVMSFHHRPDAMRALSWANKVAYCDKWGYTCFDGNIWYDSR